MPQPPESPSAALAVEAYVRPTVFADQIDETLRRLEQLDAAGRVELSRTRAWPAEIPLNSPCSDHSIVESYREFVDWANQADATIEPPFGVRRKHSMMTDEERTVLTTPVLCLAVYEHGTLEAVYPHRDDDGTYSVAEAVAALERVEAAAPERERRTGGTDADGGRCPDCGATVANVQGVADCIACGWVDAARDRQADRAPEPAGGVPRA